VERGDGDRSEPFDLTTPCLEDTITDEALLRRVQGCLMGQLTGDALGSMVEFQSAPGLRLRYPDGLRHIGPSPIWRTLAGQPTDDSELALVLARTLLRDGLYRDEDVAWSYGYWHASDPFDVGATIGVATNAILSAPAGRKAEAARRAANRKSQANGALMRQSPLAIWGYLLTQREIDCLAQSDTTLTHPNPVCRDASAAYIVALAATIRDGLDGEGAFDTAILRQEEHGETSEVTEVLLRARDSPPEYEHNIGWVLVALQNAFHQALNASSFEDGVVASVMGGGDTDTNGAIAGALLGAIHGLPAIPEQWQQAVLTCRPQQGNPGVNRPRPRAFWPVDAPILAERLAAVGRRHVEGEVS
jgi:ADP-ribosyl-[dinitrogen reductase] hydrolase